MIEDSGNRREFESGAVRDIQEGKGRCDLMPLDVVGIVTSNPIFTYIEAYKRSGDTENLVNAIRCAVSEGYLGFDSMNDAMLEVSKHFEEGAKKYGEDNWQKGIPTKSYIDSAVRHFIKLQDGWGDEPHDRAFIWNLICCIWTDQNKSECRSYPME